MKIEFEGKFMFHPFSKQIFVIGEDGNDYIIIKTSKVPKNTVYDNEEDFKGKNIKKGK